MLPAVGPPPAGTLIGEIAYTPSLSVRVFQLGPTAVQFVASGQFSVTVVDHRFSTAADPLTGEEAVGILETLQLYVETDRFLQGGPIDVPTGTSELNTEIEG